jgi:DnaJ-class molecular chaperone
MTDEIECRECDGYGWATRREPTNIDGDCPACNGTGWRAPTEDEINDRAADAYSDMCENEPPLSAQERHEVAWREKQELNR